MTSRTSSTQPSIARATSEAEPSSTEAQPRDPAPALTAVFTSSLPTSLRPKARDAAVAAIKALRPADAIKAARSVVQRISAAAKIAIRAAVAHRNAVRDARARARALAVQDRYAVPLAERVPALLKQKEYEYGRRIFDWMCRLSEQDDAEERAARKAAQAAAAA